MVRRCRVTFQCRGILLIWIIVEQGPIALAVGAGGGCLDIFLSSFFSLFFFPLWETARHRLKYCVKGPLNPKQPSNQPTFLSPSLLETTRYRLKYCLKGSLSPKEINQSMHLG